MDQLVKCLGCKPEDMCSVPGTHVDMLDFEVLWVLGSGTCSYSREDVQTGGSLELSDQLI